MQVSKSYKWQTREFEMKSVYVSLTHDEIGLMDPVSIEEARNAMVRLSGEVEALLVTELVRQGKIPPQAIQENLRPWAMNGLTLSSTTEPEPLSDQSTLMANSESTS